MNQIQIIHTEDALRSFINDAVQEAFQRLNATQPDPDTGLLTRRDACKYLGISLTTLDNLIKSRQINPIRFGRQVKFDKVELVRFSASKKKGATV